MNKLYRTKEQATLLALIGTGIAVGLLALGFIPSESSRQDQLVASGMAAFFFIFYVCRLARAGAKISESGITVRNPLKTEKLAWQDVTRFGLGRLGVYPRVGWVERTDGTRLRIWGIQGPNPLFRPTPGEAEEMIRQLNDFLQTRVRGDLTHLP